MKNLSATLGTLAAAHQNSEVVSQPATIKVELPEPDTDCVIPWFRVSAV